MWYDIKIRTNQIFLLLYLHTVCSQIPLTPCPDILQYEPRNTEIDRWYGVITITSSEQLRGIWLRITLDRPAELLGNVFGDATTSDNREFLIRSQNYILEPDTTTSVRFFVKYNAASIIPSVTEINLNGRTICKMTSSERRTSTTIRPKVTTKKLTNSRTTRPTNTNYNSEPSRLSINSNSNSNGNSFGNDNSRLPGTPSSGGSTNNYENRPITEDFYNSRPSSGGNRIPTSTTNSNNFNLGQQNHNRPDINEEPEDYSSGGISINSGDSDEFFAGDFSAVVNRPPTNRLQPTGNRNQQCGTVATQPKPLISYGQNTSPGQWPWHAALYHSKGIQLLYTCGGTLISTRHIVTAAHCVTKPHTNRAINPQNILVYLGKYNLKKFGSEIQDKEVDNIFVHPEYNHTVYFNDIAILRMADPAQITNYVRPVCLWDDVNDLNEIEGQQGTVVGWGFDQERQLSTNLMQAKMPIVSTVKCIYSNREFFSQFTSEKTFCAGFRNGTSVCNGDSGGGMVFPKRGTNGANTVWQIRGLVSVGVALQGQGVCDPSQYIVFTDVAKHIDWVQQILNRYP